MSKPPTTTERMDFDLYLRRCTDAQVLGVLEKESKANRQVYAGLARKEALKRGLEIPK